MANKLTAKTKNFANNKSHANNKTKRVQNLNYQKVTINGITIKTTTREARTIKKADRKSEK
jgi:ribosomal protein L28